MSERDLAFAPIDELSQKLRKREISSVELTNVFLSRIQSIDGKVKSYLTVTPELARKMAEKADLRLKNNDRLTPLTGIPLGLKDILLTKGVKTTCASRILENFIPPYDATVVERLENAGAVFLGKLNLDEFAMGSSTENSAFGPTRNPWNLAHIPGGSSGGSAAAVAAGLCAGSLGTDTGGSIRQPASHCGIVGLKPTYGRVSRYGVIAFASSLDQVGPMTRTVKDAAHVLQVIGGHDPRDSTSSPKPLPDFAASLGQAKMDLKGFKLGIPRQYVDPKQGGIDPPVLAAFQSAVKTLKDLGAEIIDVDLPHCGYAVATYYILAPAEASSNLARYDGIRYGYRDPSAKTLEEVYARSRAAGFGNEVKRRIMLGTYVLSAGYYDAFYLKAQKTRALIRSDFDKAFQSCDALLSPVTPEPPFKIGEKMSDPFKMYLSDIFTIAVNLAGIGGIAVPCSRDKNNLPIGLQIMHPAFGEEKVLHIAHAYEQANPLWKDHPEI